MKKIFALVLALMLSIGCVAMAETVETKGEGVMTHEEFVAAELETEVTVETYVQAKQSWWDGQVTLYTQDHEGGYFIYNLAITEEENAKLVPGTKIKVTGYKIEWSGEVEIDGSDATYEILEGEYVAEPIDVTELLASEDLVKYQNMYVSFKGMTVEPIIDAEGNEVAFLYNWDGSGEPGNCDLYFNVSVNGATYQFCVEQYLEGVSEVYEAVENLKVGDVIDMEGYLYWYEGVQPHISSVVPAAE